MHPTTWSGQHYAAMGDKGGQRRASKGKMKIAPEGLHSKCKETRWHTVQD
jgi:hypothetical protein